MEEMKMYKLKCNNGNETKVNFKNVIGRNQIRTFFANNMYAIMDSEFESILEMKHGETLKFYFPNNIKHITVVCE